MSAFLVSHAHINVLISFAKSQKLVIPSPIAPETISTSIHDDDLAGGFGLELIRENIRSLEYRYHPTNDSKSLSDSHLKRYRFHPDPRGTIIAPDSSVRIIKATHCYDYQSCETPDYARSWAAAVMRHIREAACYYVPGYDKAPWDIEDPRPR